MTTNTITHNELLLAPALMALFSSRRDGMLTQKERESAKQFAQVESYAGPVKLRPFFRSIIANFDSDLKELDRSLPAGGKERRRAIKDKLKGVKCVLDTLSPEEAMLWKRTFIKFAKHASKSRENAFEMIFPAISKYMHGNKYWNLEAVFED